MENRIEYPLISIGIPTYNRGKGLLRTLASIWAQNYPNLEVIVSDNCSPDNTQELVQESVLEHSELKYHRQSVNIGMIPNFEFVLRKAAGKYFMWVADDDALEAGVLLKYVRFLESHADYSLVSGEIKYWIDNKHDLSERGFTFEQKSSSLRLLGYYSRVVYGGMIHGLMRRELTLGIELRSAIGNDFHFIANLAYLGEIKHFDFVGYHKNFGGTSKDFKQYARQIGDSDFAGNFPHLKMAFDAFKEVMYRSKVFSRMHVYSRFTLAVSAFSSMIVRYYAGIFPFMVGGRLKRFILNPLHLKPKNSNSPSQPRLI